VTVTAAPASSLLLEDVDPAVIQGTVVQSDRPVVGAYVRLLDVTGGVAAEVPTDRSGSFRFLAEPGSWTVLALAPGSTADLALEAGRGQVHDLVVTI
jgi:hypothetical protein